MANLNINSTGFNSWMPAAQFQGSNPAETDYIIFADNDNDSGYVPSFNGNLFTPQMNFQAQPSTSSSLNTTGNAFSNAFAATDVQAPGNNTFTMSGVTPPTGNSTSIPSGVTSPSDLQSAAGIINDNLNVFTNGDPSKKSISGADLLRPLDSADPKYTPDIKAAAQYLKDHPDQMNELDLADGQDDNQIPVDVFSEAAGNEPIQGDYGFNDANKSVDTNKSALQSFKNMLGRLDTEAGGAADGLISETDMRAALNDNTGKYTSKEKAALNYIYNVRMNPNDQNSTLWEAMDGTDSLVEENDINDAINSTAPLSTIHNNSIANRDGSALASARNTFNIEVAS